MPALEPVFLAGHILQRLAGDKAANVVEQDFQVTPGNVNRAGGHVRSDQDVLEVPQRMIDRQRLLFENIQRRTCDLACVQCLAKIIELDDHTAADVDQIRRSLHLLNCRSVEHSSGSRRVRCGDNDEIALS